MINSLSMIFTASETTINSDLLGYSIKLAIQTIIGGISAITFMSEIAINYVKDNLIADVSYMYIHELSYCSGQFEF